MQPGDDLRALIVPLEVEPLGEVVRRVEERRDEEVQERPQLVQVVLQRRARDEETMLRIERANDAGEEGILVLDAVGLVDVDASSGERRRSTARGITRGRTVSNRLQKTLKMQISSRNSLLFVYELFPFDLGEESFLPDYHLIRGHDDIVFHYLGLGCISLLLISMELERGEIIRPSVDLAHPIRRRGLRNEDQMGSGVVAVLLQVREEGEGLQCLTETHLI
jgi:hypothetical protein